MVMNINCFFRSYSLDPIFKYLQVTKTRTVITMLQKITIEKKKAQKRGEEEKEKKKLKKKLLYNTHLSHKAKQQTKYI